MSDRDPAERLRELEKLVGTMVAAKYHVTRLIGRGGMGAVYEAENVVIGKKVALKFVDREFARDETMAGRFAREARAASSIESEHIVQVFDAGSDGGRPYIVMELLRGEDLGTRLRREDRVPMEDALHIVAQMLSGLARAHAAGIVHRDLKPDNVFLLNRGTDESFVKIVDFGISKIERAQSGTAPLVLTHKGSVMGTPLYMSPEQAQAFSDVDARSDLFSVGSILFECLAGRPPHTGNSYEQVLLGICMTDAPDIRAIAPAVPESVAELIARALQRDRRARFGSAAAMLDALHAVAPIEKTRVPLDAADVKTLSARATPTSSSSSSSPGSDRASRTSRPSPSRPLTAVTWANPAATSGEAPPESPSRVILPLTALIATLTGVAVTLWIVAAMHGEHGGPRAQAKEAATHAAAATAQASASVQASASGSANPLLGAANGSNGASAIASSEHVAIAAPPATGALGTSLSEPPPASASRPHDARGAASKGTKHASPNVRPESATPRNDVKGPPPSSDLDLQRDLP